jgi:hypothetical protein
MTTDCSTDLFGFAAVGVEISQRLVQWVGSVTKSLAGLCTDSGAEPWLPALGRRGSVSRILVNTDFAAAAHSRYCRVGP